LGSGYLVLRPTKTGNIFGLDEGKEEGGQVENDGLLADK